MDVKLNSLIFTILTTCRRRIGLINAADLYALLTSVVIRRYLESRVTSLTEGLLEYIGFFRLQEHECTCTACGIDDIKLRDNASTALGQLKDVGHLLVVHNNEVTFNIYILAQVIKVLNINLGHAGHNTAHYGFGILTGLKLTLCLPVTRSQLLKLLSLGYPGVLGDLGFFLLLCFRLLFLGAHLFS